MQEDRVYDNLLNLPLFLGMSRNDLLEVAGHTKFDFQKAEKDSPSSRKESPANVCTFFLPANSTLSQRLTIMATASKKTSKPQKRFKWNASTDITNTSLTPISQRKNVA